MTTYLVKQLAEWLIELTNWLTNQSTDWLSGNIKPSTGTCPEPGESNPKLHILSLQDPFEYYPSI